MKTTVTLPRDLSLKTFILIFSLIILSLFFVGKNAYSSSDTKAPVSFEKDFAKKKDKKYRLFLGKFQNDVPIDVVEMFASMGDVKSVKAFDGSYSFYSKAFDTVSEMKEASKEYATFGAETLIQVQEINGEITFE